MKKAFKILVLLLVCFFSISATLPQEAPQVYSFHGLYEKIQNQPLVKLGWFIQSSYPNEVSTYIIKRNGQYLRTVQILGYGVVQIEVEPGYRTSTFSIVRYVSGNQSQEYTTIVSKNN